MSNNFKLQAKFINARPFEALLHYLHNSTGAGAFVFDKNSISYIRAKSNFQIVNEVKILGHKLVKYEFNDEEPCSLMLNNEQILNHVKHTGNGNGKDHLELRARNDSNTLELIYTLAGNIVQQNSFTMPVINADQVVEDINAYRRAETNPNVCVAASDFTSICSRCCPKGNNTQLIIYDKGVRFSNSASSNKDSHSETPLGDTNTSELGRLTLNYEIVQMLTKLKMIAPPNGVLRLYYEGSDLPLRIITDIGTYGTLTIHLSNL